MKTDASQDFRSYLMEAFQTRRLRNPAYSMRAFARDLEMSPSRLNDVLKGRYGISPQAALSIAQKLRLNESEKTTFCHLVTAKHSRLKKERKSAEDLLKGSKRSLKEKQIGLDQFKFMADWYHLAILELLVIKDCEHSATEFSRRLKVPEEKIQEALERLIRLGLLKKEKNKFKAEQDYTLVNANLIPSQVIRKFHSQILAKALESVEGHRPEDRLLNTLVLAVNRKKMARAQELINEFKKKFNSEMSLSADADDVFALSIQYFSLTQEESL